MRAAVLRAYREPLSLETVEDPVCETDGVVLKVLACGICRSDWHGWVGEHPKVRPGDIPGHEYCGEVVEAGPLAKWRPGDRVIAPFILACGDCPDCRSGQTTTCRSQRVPGFGDRGAWAEYVSVPHAHNLTRLPDSLSPALAAGLGAAATAGAASEAAGAAGVAARAGRLPPGCFRMLFSGMSGGGGRSLKTLRPSLSVHCHCAAAPMAQVQATASRRSL